MLTIISPSSFKQIPWKNGKGTTTELAISAGGSLDNFDWRLSIASVVEDGEFSDFSGFLRNLILIEGNGIELRHEHKQIDQLTRPLEFATFDGGWRTTGKLHDGPIQDLNLITRFDKYACKIDTWIDTQTQQHPLKSLNFVFSLTAETHLSSDNNTINTNLPKRHLARIESEDGTQLSVTGENLILIRLQPLK